MKENLSFGLQQDFSLKTTGKENLYTSYFNFFSTQKTSRTHSLNSVAKRNYSFGRHHSKLKKNSAISNEQL